MATVKREHWTGTVPLTPRQLVALQVVFELIEVLGELPTYEEIGVELGIASKGSVARVLYKLRDGGWISLDDRRGADRLVVLVPPPVMPPVDLVDIELLPAGLDYVQAHRRRGGGAA